MVSYGKYLQVLFIFFTFKGDLNRIKTLIDNFLNDHKELTTLFNGMKVIPEDEVSLKRRDTIKAAKKPEESKEVFADAEVTRLVEMAKDMESKAKNGLIKEAGAVFTDIFEAMKTKNFSASQKASQCAIYSKIVKFHNAKSCYDEALTFTSKLMDFTDDNTPTILKIEVCINSAASFCNKNDFAKAKMMISTALSMAREDFGEKSVTYANSLVAYADYLGSTDQ